MTVGRMERLAVVTAALIGLGTACAADGVAPAPAPSPAPTTSADPLTQPTATWTPAPMPTAPPARPRVSASDPAGDPETRRPRNWFVPSTDITSVTIEYDAASKSLEFAIGFADLRELEHDGRSYVQSIMLSAAGQTQDLYLERHPRHGVSLVNRSVPSLRHYGGVIEPCRGARTRVDIDADLVVIAAPARCLAQGRRDASFTVWTGSEQRSSTGPMRELARDQVELARAVTTR